MFMTNSERHSSVNLFTASLIICQRQIVRLLCKGFKQDFKQEIFLKQNFKQEIFIKQDFKQDILF